MNAPLALRLADAIEEPNRPNKKRAIKRAADELRRLQGENEHLRAELERARQSEAAAVLAEREACAALCRRYAVRHVGGGTIQSLSRIAAAEDCEGFIRARSA